jgi:hypothetical protein
MKWTRIAVHGRQSTAHYAGLKALYCDLLSTMWTCERAFNAPVTHFAHHMMTAIVVCTPETTPAARTQNRRPAHLLASTHRASAHAPLPAHHSVDRTRALTCADCQSIRVSWRAPLPHVNNGHMCLKWARVASSPSTDVDKEMQIDLTANAIVLPIATV